MSDEAERLSNLSHQCDRLLERNKRLSMFLNKNVASSGRMVRKLKRHDLKLNVALAALEYYASMSGDNGVAGKALARLKDPESAKEGESE